MQDTAAIPTKSVRFSHTFTCCLIPWVLVKRQHPLQVRGEVVANRNRTCAEQSVAAECEKYVASCMYESTWRVESS